MQYMQESFKRESSWYDGDWEEERNVSTLIRIQRDYYNFCDVYERMKRVYADVVDIYLKTYGMIFKAHK